MKRVLKNSLIALALIAGLGAGVYAWRQKTEQDPAQRYKLQTIEKGDLAQSVSANGTLNPVSLVNVGTQVSGTVKKLYVDFNDKVEKGQKLLELDDVLLAAQVRQSQASMTSASASLDLARANEKRLQSLFAQEYVSRQELDQAVQARKAAEAQLAQARAQNERDRANHAFSIIRSPVEGIVVDRVVDLGQTVAASFQTPTLIKIARDLSKMQIDSAFAEADIGNIRVGQNVRFNVDAFPNRSFNGKVRQIRLNPVTNQNVVTYNVVVAVDNPEETLLPGMTAYVNIVVAQRQDVLLVPNAALRFKPAEAGSGREKRGERGNGGQPRTDAGASAGQGSGTGPRGEGQRRRRDAASGTVYVLAPTGELKPVSVTLGITDSRNTEVVGGELKAGDRVVTGEAQGASETGPGTGSGGQVRMRMF